MSDDEEYISDEEVRVLRERAKKKAEEWHTQNKEKATRVGKEPFDLDRLNSLRKYPPLEENIRNFRETMSTSYEQSYYADDDVMTLKEMAERLDRAYLYGFDHEG